MTPAPLRSSTGLSIIISTVEFAATEQAALLVSLFGEIAIDFLQELE